MNSLKQRLFTNWHFMRILRLALAVWLLVMAIRSHDTAIGIFSAFLVYTALAGVGCCGPNGCYVPTQKQNAHDEPIDYEEIK